MLLEINGAWYDCESFANTHPGGRHLLAVLDGKNATDLFRSMHRGPAAQAALRRLPRHTRPSPQLSSRLARSFHKLGADVEAAGLYTLHPQRYLARAAVLSVLLASAVACRIVNLSAILFALFLQQIAFIGHDAGHNSVLASRTANARLGLLVGNALSGVAISWWKATHNMHHTTTNSVDCDPDIQHAPALVLSTAYLQRQPVHSQYHKRTLVVSPFWRRVLRVQHWYFYPLMAVARFNLYAQSWCHVAAERDACGAVALGVYHAALATWLCSWPTVAAAVQWLFVSHALAGVLHVQIAVSHFFMEFYSGATHKGVPSGEAFVRTQLATTTDITCPSWLDWWHGGLQFQVAHHLFPRVPRDNLRALTGMVQGFCEREGLAYHSVSWWGANCALLRRLKVAGQYGDGSAVYEACQAEG